MLSDKLFSNCERGEIQEMVVLRGQSVRVQKAWENYTTREKALAINYKFPAGVDVIELLLELELLVEKSKSVDLAPLAAQVQTLIAEVANFNVRATDLRTEVDELKTEVERRATPEYVNRVENWAMDRFEQLTELVKSLTETTSKLCDRVEALEAKTTVAEAPSSGDSQEHSEIMREVTGH